MTPSPARRSDGATARMPSQAPVRLTSTTRRNDAGLCSFVVPQSMKPAMLARTETGPKSRSVPAGARCQSSSRVTSRSSDLHCLAPPCPGHPSDWHCGHHTVPRPPIRDLRSPVSHRGHLGSWSSR